MLPISLRQAFFWAILTTSVSAERTLDDLSFGNQGHLSSHGGAGIPGWQASSSQHNLQILSDRAILTPPYPGNTRGALWTEKTMPSEAWRVFAEFRVGGQESGSGSFNIFYAKDKNPVLVETASTAGRFDGLVITIDQYGGSGGKIRGFLNDGTQDFKSHSHLESLAFGQCDYAYRNLGRPSRLTILNQNGLAVEIDGRECFRSEKISLPAGYYFGITASTADQADSFEAWKFVAAELGKEDAPPPPPPAQQEQHQQQQQQQQREQVPQLQKLDRFPRAPEAVPDRAPEEIKGQQDQFADLHNRLQALSHQIAEVFGELRELADKLDDQHEHIMGTDGTGHNIGLNAKIDGLHRRLENVERITEHTRKGYENVERIVEYSRKGYQNIEQIVEYTRKELEGRSYHEHYHRLNEAIETVTASTPRMGFFLVVVVGMQVLLAGSYVVYKRRRANMPKKYL